MRKGQIYVALIASHDLRNKCRLPQHPSRCPASPDRHTDNFPFSLHIRNIKRSLFEHHKPCAGSISTKALKEAAGASYPPP